MDLLTVNQEKCLRCGICVECCPSCILSMGENGPECNFDRGCMSCGQCVAICPVGALDNKYTPLAEQRPVTMPLPTPEVAYEFLRMRRSVRNFKPQTPTDEEITRMLDVARYAPTAGNSQGMYYIVIRDKEQIRAIADAVADWMEAEVAAGTENKRYFQVVLRAYRERGQDIIARNAPCLIFALARRLNITGVSNAEQSWAYAELFAPTIGLGTTIAGFIQSCGIAGYQPLLDMIAVPGDTPASTIAAIIADEAAIGMVNSKTTAVRIIPAPGKTVGDEVEFGGLFGRAPIMRVSPYSAEAFIARGGRIPAPLQSLKN